MLPNNVVGDGIEFRAEVLSETVRVLTLNNRERTSQAVTVIETREIIRGADFKVRAKIFFTEAVGLYGAQKIREPLIFKAILVDNPYIGGYICAASLCTVSITEYDVIEDGLHCNKVTGLPPDQSEITAHLNAYYELIADQAFANVEVVL